MSIKYESIRLEKIEKNRKKSNLTEFPFRSAIAIQDKILLTQRRSTHGNKLLSYFYYFLRPTPIRRRIENRPCHFERFKKQVE